MRLPIAVFAALLAVPAFAQAGVVGLEGTQLVFRADPGERVSLISGFGGNDVFFFSGAGVRPGPGCAATAKEVECSPTGVTGVAIVTGDGSDRVAHYGHLPLTLTLGAGDDTFHGQSQSVTVDAGPGDDLGVIEARQATAGGGDGADDLELSVGDRDKAPSTLDGGMGNDVLTVRHDGPYASRPGGLRPGRAAPVTITCGPGADRWAAGPYDLPGDGCASSVAGVTTRTVSRAFREGSLTGPASGSVTLRRMTDGGDPRQTIARGVFTAQPGPLRVSLKRTRIGTRWLRRKPNLPVSVTIRTRTGADRGEVSFRSRIG